MQPVLRFPEFNGEWEYNLFSEVVTNKSKKFNPKSDEIRQDIELDSIEQGTGRLLNTYVSKDFTSQKNIFDKGSVLYSKLRPYLNKYYYTQFSGVCSSEIWVLNSLNNQKLSNLFLYFFIQTNRFSNVANKSAGSKMPRADWGLVENVRLYKGSIEEQEKIGNFFQKIDKQIELEENKLKLLEQQKRGYMQRIFSQELRFKDKNENEYPKWETQKLGQIVMINTGKSKISNEIDGEFFNLGSTGIIGKSSHYDYEGSFLLTARVGHYAGSLYTFKGKANISDNTIFIQTNLHLEFIKELLNNYNLKRLAFGSGQPLIKSSELKKLKFNIPCVEEIEKIGKLFNKLNRTIELHSSKLELLRQRKKGLLQKMFV